MGGEHDPYDGREQSYAKHLILEGYLEELALKVGQFRQRLTLNYVDGFAGPWESRTDDMSDTSPALALTRLAAVQEKLRAGGRDFLARAFFVSVNAKKAEELRRLAARYPTIETQVVTGTFDSHIADARRFVKTGHDPFAFIFIDPTGWTGFGLHAIAPLLREVRGEVLLNFMTGHISRLIDNGPESIGPSLVDLFGDARFGQEWRGFSKLDREERMVAAYSTRLAQAAGYRHCVSAVILNPKADRTHYHLIYGTHSDAGLIAFRGIERRVLAVQRERRAGARQRAREERSGQPSLFSATELVARTYEEDLRERYLPRATQVLDEMVSAREEVPWRDLLIHALQVPMVSEVDVREWADARRGAGVIEVLGLGPRGGFGDGQQVRVRRATP